MPERRGRLVARIVPRRVLTLAGRSRLHEDVVERFGAPHGGIVDLVVEELEARGFFRVEDGYWGGVPPDERARPSRRQRKRADRDRRELERDDARSAVDSDEEY